MALTLDPTLQTAQNGQSHHPIVEILSSQWTEEIPFDGQFLTTTSTNEEKPNFSVHSSGRLIGVYKLGDSQIKYVYTDTIRQSFSYATFNLPPGLGTILGVSVCELSNGNIGIIYIYSYGSNYYLRYKTITVDGTSIAENAIANWATSIWASEPFVIKLANNSYLMVYVKKIGSDYIVYKRTSSNFTTWSSESILSISGLTSTHKIDNPSLNQITTGDIFLWFDYVDSYGVDDSELKNIYYSKSSDNGINWSTAVKITNYTTYGTTAEHPIAIQKIANFMTMVYTELNNALHIDDSTDGWCSSTGYQSIKNIQFDSVNRKIYVVAGSNAGGYKYLTCVVKVDMDTWTIENCWKCDTSPAFNPVFCTPGAGDAAFLRYYGDQNYVPVSNNSSIAILDGEADTITHYNFWDNPSYGLVKNVPSFDPFKYDFAYQLNMVCCHVVASTNRLYILFTGGTPGISSTFIELGYIDLTESGPEYTWNIVITSDDYSLGYCFCTDFLLLSDLDLVVMPFGQGLFADNGTLMIWNISTGALYKSFHHPTDESFPSYGLDSPVYCNGKLYFSFPYSSEYTEAEKRGLMELDMTAWTVQYHRPAWATLDDYVLHNKVITEDNKIIIASDYGITIFNPVDASWVLYNNTNIPDLTGDGGDRFFPICYDQTNKMIFGGHLDSFGFWGQLVAISLFGVLKQSQYTIGEYTTSWSFGTANNLVQGYLDYETSPVYGPDDGSMYAFWTNNDENELSVKWDKESANFNLNDYLVRDNEIALKWTIDGDSSKLNFTVSHGHLFDPHNILSLWSNYLKKGRKLIVREGEKVSGIDYWQNQGTFSISETSIDYERGIYPTMTITAEDRSSIWRDHNVIATDHFTAEPDQLLISLLTSETDMELTDFNLSVFSGSYELQIQWLDTTVWDIVKQVCNRFHYFPIFDVNNKFTARKIANDNPINHTYSDNTKLIKFTPDDTFSDYTNKIIVTGEELDYIEVEYAEERITTMNGTVGWWGYKKDFEIYYSDDKSRRCRNPRLNQLESATSIMFQLAGKITEEISQVDIYDKYCVVTIEAPNLIPILLLGIYEIITGLFEGDIETGTMTIPVGSLDRTIGILLVLNVLASVGNYQYEIWAQPLGKIRRSIQAIANDIELQAELGMVVEKKYDEPLCYTVAQCQNVADFEMFVTQSQRKRVKFEKIAHLQDEVGDTIVVPHPYTNLPLTIYITDLSRKMKIPTLGDTDGYWYDEIEGWVL